MTYETLLYELEDRVLTITLHRPDRLNAFTGTMCSELIDAYDRADRDDDVRAIILTGAGRAFCAGADLSQGAATFDHRARQSQVSGSDLSDPAIRDSGGRVTLRMHDCLKPILAAVNGPAVGIGATMLLAADLRLASSAARFGFVFTRRGIVPEAASSFFLPHIVGLPRALEWCLTGRVFDAAEALQGGLVRSLHAPDDLLPAAMALAREIADNTAPVSVALTRQMLWRLAAASEPMQAHRIDSRGIFTRGASADAAEGVTSFLEKRPANFPCKVSTDMPTYFPWWDEPTYT